MDLKKAAWIVAAIVAVVLIFLLLLQMAPIIPTEPHIPYPLEENLRRYEEQRQKLTEQCSSLCAKANSDASLISKAQYCAKSFEEGLDVTRNSLLMDYTEEFIVAIGICEDRIYCPQAYDCEIGGGTTLTMQRCKELICAYWDSVGDTPEQKDEKLKTVIEPGACYSNPENQPRHWFTSLFDSDGDGWVSEEEISCG